MVKKSKAIMTKKQVLTPELVESLEGVISNLQKFAENCIQKQTAIYTVSSFVRVFAYQKARFDVMRENIADIIENGAVLKEETAPPYHIAFSCKKEAKQLFQDLSKMIADDGRTVTSLDVHSAENNNLQVGITIECLSIEGFDLSLISEYLALFTNSSSKEMNKQDVPAALMKINDVKHSNPINVIQDKVVGVIKRPDNSSIVFYKDSDGKLKTLIKQKEE